LDFSREQRLAIWTLAGLALIAIAIGSGRRHFKEPGDVEFVQAGVGVDASSASSQDSGGRIPRSASSGQIAVHVAGEVKKPGLYTLQDGSRIADAIKLAGGPSLEADIDAVNLAAKVEDGSQIFVPSKKQTRLLPSPRSFPSVSVSKNPGSAEDRITAALKKTSASGGKLSRPGEGMVNINTAGPEELERLPGVGPATAQKILDYRAANGPFKAVEELMDVKGIGPAKFEKMRPFIQL